jgi:hypothetical protein
MRARYCLKAIDLSFSLAVRRRPTVSVAREKEVTTLKG